MKIGEIGGYDDIVVGQYYKYINISAFIFANSSSIFLAVAKNKGLVCNTSKPDVSETKDVYIKYYFNFDCKIKRVKRPKHITNQYALDWIKEHKHKRI